MAPPAASRGVREFGDEVRPGRAARDTVEAKAPDAARAAAADGVDAPHQRHVAARTPNPGARGVAGGAAGVLLGICVTAAALAALAADRAAAQARPGLAADEPLPDVSAAELMESARSEVRVIARDNHEVEEYRVGNNVYMVKVKPANAPPYYLIDEDGSGNLQWKRGMDLEHTSVPHWAVLRW